MNAPLDIDVVLKSLVTWRVGDTTQIKACTTEGITFIPDALLEQVHPLFAQSLRAALAWDKEQGALDPVVTAVQSDITLLLLRVPPKHCKAVSGVEVPLQFIDNITFKPDGNIMLSHLTVQVGYVNDKEPRVPFLKDYDWADTTFSVPALRHAFPDWDKRWVISGELGLADANRIDYAFFPTTTRPTHTLTGVTFE